MNDNNRTDIYTRLGQDARMLKQARMLPMDEPLKVEDVEAVRQDFIAYCARHNISNARVAKSLGYSPSVLSQWLKGNYAGDMTAVTHAINNWLESDFRTRNARVQTDFVPTRIAEEMLGAMETCVEMSMMCGVIAPAGCGKTMVLQTLIQRRRGFLIYGHEDMSPSAFFREVARACGARMPDTRARNTDMLEAIVAKLKGSRRPLGIDEGHRLPKPTFARVRTVFDMAECPIIITGTSEMLSQLNDRAAERGQFASRTMLYNATDASGVDFKDPDPGSDGLGLPLFTRDEIEALYKKSKVKFHPGAIEMLWALACVPGGGALREVKRIVDVIVKSKDGVITRSDIISAKIEISGRVGQQQLGQAKRFIDERKIA